MDLVLHINILWGLFCCILDERRKGGGKGENEREGRVCVDTFASIRARSPHDIDDL